MTTLFGFRIVKERKHLTDEEFISESREFLLKYEGQRKWLIGFHIVIAALNVVVFASGLNLVWKMAPLLQGAPGAQEIWFCLGLFIGCFGGHQMTRAVHALIEIIVDTKDIRTKRLLVHYHDEFEAISPNAISEQIDAEASSVSAIVNCSNVALTLRREDRRGSEHGSCHSELRCLECN